MKIHTYYAPVPGFKADDELRLINLWRKYHAGLGLEPIVLAPYHANRHPFYWNIHQKCLELPTINNKAYEIACFDRWIAMATQGPGIHLMSDYDVFLRPAPIVWKREGLHLYANNCPCLVSGTEKDFERFAWEFARYDPAGEKHCSDQTIIEALRTKDPASIPAEKLVEDYSAPGWMECAGVHFANRVMHPAGKIPRYKWIPELLNEKASS